MSYFIHSFKDIGSKFLCQKVNYQTYVHGEYDIQGKVWHPCGDAGTSYKRTKIEYYFCDYKDWQRFRISELNENITVKEAEEILKQIKEYKDK